MSDELAELRNRLQDSENTIRDIQLHRQSAERRERMLREAMQKIAALGEKEAEIVGLIESQYEAALRH
jgi:Xaa-Pro aminopeptidase